MGCGVGGILTSRFMHATTEDARDLWPGGGAWNGKPPAPPTGGWGLEIGAWGSGGGLFLHEGFDGLEDGVPGDGAFDEVVGDAELAGLGGPFVFEGAAEDDDAHGVVGGVVFDEAEDLAAVHVGHHPVEYDDVWGGWVGVEPLEGAGAAVQDVGVVASAAEEALHCLCGVGVVFDYEHMAHGLPSEGLEKWKGRS